MSYSSFTHQWTDGERIKNIRTQMGLNQREFAEKMGCSQGAVCQWEKNQKPPSGTAMKLAVLLLQIHNGVLVRVGE